MSPNKMDLLEKIMTLGTAPLNEGGYVVFIYFWGGLFAVAMLLIFYFFGGMK